MLKKLWKKIKQKIANWVLNDPMILIMNNQSIIEDKYEIVPITVEVCLNKPINIKEAERIASIEIGKILFNSGLIDVQLRAYSPNDETAFTKKTYWTFKT